MTTFLLKYRNNMTKYVHNGGKLPSIKLGVAIKFHLNESFELLSKDLLLTDDLFSKLKNDDIIEVRLNPSINILPCVIPQIEQNASFNNHPDSSDTINEINANNISNNGHKVNKSKTYYNHKSKTDCFTTSKNLNDLINVSSDSSIIVPPFSLKSYALQPSKTVLNKDGENKKVHIVDKVVQSSHRKTTKLDKTNSSNGSSITCKSILKTKRKSLKEKIAKRPVSEKYYRVENILKEITKDGNVYYLIKWVHYKKATWEPKENVTQEALDYFWNNKIN